MMTNVVEHFKKNIAVGYLYVSYGKILMKVPYLFKNVFKDLYDFVIYYMLGEWLLSVPVHTYEGCHNEIGCYK